MLLLKNWPEINLVLETLVDLRAHCIKNYTTVWDIISGNGSSLQRHVSVPPPHRQEGFEGLLIDYVEHLEGKDVVY